MKIKEKLHAIQHELKAPKNQYNSFGKYAYRSCEDILEALKPLTFKYKCSLVVQDEILQIGDRYYIKAIANLYDIETEDFMTTHAFAREDENKKDMDGSQVTGASSSYARKYALNAMFMIDDAKDADTDESAKVQQKTEALITPNQIKIIKENMTDERIAKMLAYYKCEKLENLTLKNASECIQTLKKEKEKQ